MTNPPISEAIHAIHPNPDLHASEPHAPVILLFHDRERFPFLFQTQPLVYDSFEPLLFDPGKERLPKCAPALGQILDSGPNPLLNDGG